MRQRSDPEVLRRRRAVEPHRHNGLIPRTEQERLHRKERIRRARAAVDLLGQMEDGLLLQLVVVIEHVTVICGDLGMLSRYAHLEPFDVKRGEVTIPRGQFQAGQRYLQAREHVSSRMEPPPQPVRRAVQDRHPQNTGGAQVS